MFVHSRLMMDIHDLLLLQRGVQKSSADKSVVATKRNTLIIQL